MMIKYAGIAVLIGLLYAGAIAQSGDAIAKQALSASGITGGLCVSLGSTDGSLEAGLASGGRILVHALTKSASALNQTRQHLQSVSLYGVASAEMIGSFSTLPYAHSIVNLLVGDLDALGSDVPPQSEILRVLAPRGVAYTKKNGTWTKLSKPVPAGFDEWHHYNRDPDNNAVSLDQQVDPPQSAQWLAWYSRPNNHGLHGDISSAHRLANGRSFYISEYLATEGTQKIERNFVEARDAFSGVKLWSKAVDAKMDPRFPLVAQGDRVYTVLGPGKPLVALDAATGNISLTYDKGPLLGTNPSIEGTLLTNGYLVCNWGGAVTVLSESDGTVKWSYKESDGSQLAFVAVAEDQMKVFVVSCGGDAKWGRWSGSRAKSILCLDLNDGSLLWRCSEFISKGGGDLTSPNVGLLVYSQGKLALFGPTGIGAVGDDPYLGIIETTNGKLLWQHDYHTSLGKGLRGRIKGTTVRPSYWKCPDDGYTYWPVWGKTCVFRDGAVWVLSGDVYGFEAETGVPTKRFEPKVPNQRCSRPRATSRYFIQGFLSFAKENFDFCYQQIGRSGCASGPVPGNGMLYYGGNGQCGCFTFLRCQVTASPQLPGAIVDDKDRIEKGAALGKLLAPTTPVSYSSMASSTEMVFPARVPIDNSTPLHDDWYNNDYVPSDTTEPLVANGKTYVGIPNEHRLECRSGSQVAWSFTAGGRISHGPVVTGGTVLFGAHDGYVYCLRESDGALVWRFLAAPGRRRIVAFSQVESASPVFGVTLHDGKLVASAGRHPELDGGIVVWGLEPASGAISWKTVLKTNIAFVPSDSRIYSTTVNRILNDVPLSEGSVIKLPGVTIGPDGFTAARHTRARKHTRGVPVVKNAPGGIAIDFGTSHASAVVHLNDMRGRTILSHVQYNGSSCLIPTIGMGPGHYVLRITSGTASYSVKVMLAARRN